MSIVHVSMKNKWQVEVLEESIDDIFLLII